MKHNAPDAAFEQLVRTQLGELSELAPTEVRGIHDVDLVPVNPRRMPFGRAVAIGGAAVALAGGLTLTGIAATGGDDGGGNTPEDAVLEFVDAIEQSDVLGALDVIDPGESDVLIDAVTTLVEEGTRIGLLNDEADAGKVTGAAATIDGLQLSVDQVATDLAVVTLNAGTAQLAVDLSALPLGPDIATQVDATGTSSETSTIDFATDPLSIATVERDGRWYVSFGYSIAEAARRSADLPFPVDAGIVSAGFDSADAAATAFWTNAAALDVEAAIATFAPGEADAISRYASLWLPGVNASITELQASGLEINVSDLRFDVGEDGSRRRVEPVGYVIEGTLPPATSPGLPPFQPDAPTVVFVADGSGFYIIEAGEPMPDSFDDLELIKDFPVEFANDGVSPNSATLNRDGTVDHYWADEEISPAPTPRQFRIEFSNGCTTTRGALADDALVYGPLPEGLENLGDGSYRSCSTDQATSTISAFTLLTFGRSGLLAPTLPAIDVVEMDGRWYVSPVGSIGVQLLDLARDVEDGQVLSIDSPVAMYIYGVDRSMLDRQLVGQQVTDLGPDCATIVEVGTDGRVTGIATDVDLATVRQCTESDAFWGSSTVEYSDEPADVEPVGPASTVLVQN